MDVEIQPARKILPSICAYRPVQRLAYVVAERAAHVPNLTHPYPQVANSVPDLDQWSGACFRGFQRGVGGGFWRGAGFLCCHTGPVRERWSGMWSSCAAERLATQRPPALALGGTPFFFRASNRVAPVLWLIPVGRPAALLLEMLFRAGFGGDFRLRGGTAWFMGVDWGCFRRGSRCRS